MRYDIEQGVPMPETRGIGPRFPLDLLEVGQSFVVPKSEAPAVKSAISRLKKRTDKDFAFRNADGVNRVWRIA